jgi:hypothetical protein
MVPIPHAAAGKLIVTAAAGKLEKPDELGQDAERFAEQITGSGRKELGAWFADHIRLHRMKSQLGILRKAQIFAEEAGYEPQIVNLKLLVPLLEAGSLEEEDDQEMTYRWAALLANAARGGPGPLVLPSFPDVLRQLTSVDASVLDVLYNQFASLPREELTKTVVPGANLRNALGLDPQSFAVSVENLYRLRLAAPPSTTFDFVEPKGTRYQIAGTEQICLTDFGRAFVTVCRPPTAKAV